MGVEGCRNDVSYHAESTRVVQAARVRMVRGDKTEGQVRCVQLARQGGWHRTKGDAANRSAAAEVRITIICSALLHNKTCLLLRRPETSATAKSKYRRQSRNYISQHLNTTTSQHLNTQHSTFTMYFFNRRPRGFHHTFRFSNEQRDLLNNLRRGVPPEELAERSIREAEPPSRRRQNGQVRLLGLLVMIGFLLIAIILLIAM